MIKAFSLIYFQQLKRVLQEIGLWRRLVLIFLAFTLASAVTFRLESDPILICAVVFAVTLTIHLQRKDRKFLKIVNVNEKVLFFVHYHLLAIPVYFVLLILGEVLPFVFLFSGTSFISILGFKIQPVSFYHFDLIKLLPLKNFELRSGIRKNKYLLLIGYGAGLALHQYPMVAFGIIVLFTLMATTFYNESEPWIMLEVYQLAPREFLLAKILNHLKVFWAFCIPLILVFLSGAFSYWYIMLVLILVSSIIQALSICLKYTFYEPGNHFDNSVFIAIYSLSLIVIFFIPVPLVMLVYYSGKAVRNLNNFLYDYH